MPIWLTLIFSFLKALVTGEFKREWQGHKEQEVQNAENKDMAADSATLQQRLRQWTRK